MFDPIHIGQHEALYPPALRFHLTTRAPTAITARGNLNLLHGTPLVALFCSVRCSSAIILQTYDLARALRDAGVTIISGFHSPMEKECRTVLLGGSQPVIVCPARSIERLRLPIDWKTALLQDRLLLLSPFAEKQRHPTTGRARQRNEFVAALADTLLIAHATPGGKTERFCREMLAWGKPLLTLESSENTGLLALGAKSVQLERISAQPEIFNS